MAAEVDQFLIQRLRRVPLFTDVKEPMLQEIAGQCRLAKFKATHPLFYQGAHAPGLHVILNGEVVLQRDLGSGDTLAFATRKAGDCLGEISLLDGRAATATAIAKTEVWAGILLPVDFERFISKSPSAALVLLKSVAERLRETTELLVSAHGQTLCQRLAEFLLDEADEGNIVRFESQRAVGERIGGTREAVNRAIRHLCEVGALEPLEKRNVYRVNSRRLSALAGR